MRKIILPLVLLCSFCACAQSDAIINKTTLLIAEGKYNDAEKYLNGILEKDPQNIDAMMMMGNVFVNYELMQTPALQIITPEDESIFSKDLASLKERIVLIDQDRTYGAEKAWLYCLTMDSSRLDIRKGLCSLYAMAGMQDKLVNYLPVIVAHSRDKGNDFAYTLVEYGRLLHERGDKDGAYLVYKKIAELYPQVSGINCMISTSYFSDNDLVHTKEYVEKAMSAKTPDISVCHDALDIYSAISDPAKVMSLLKQTDKDVTVSDYPFYLAIYKYNRRDTSWKKDMQVYLDQFVHPADTNPMYNAAKYMTSAKYKGGYKDEMSLLSYNLSDFAARLMTERLIADHKDSVQPYIIEAQILINDKEYAKANTLLAAFTKKYPALTDMQYYYAYSLYCAGEYTGAIDAWSKFAEAVRKKKSAGAELDAALSAPYYFIAQSYMKTNNITKGKEYFKLILDGKDASKYAYMAKITMDKNTPKAPQDSLQQNH